MKLKQILLILACVEAFLGSTGWTEDILPYTTRTHSYNGWNASARGDIRTVGMGGSTVGLADTFLAASDNPSGLAMTLFNADLNFTTDNIRDAYIQSDQNPLSLSSYGAAMNLYPWGFSIGYVTSYREGQDYLIPGAPLVSTTLGIRTSELRMAAARLIEIGGHRFSLGASLNIGMSDESISGESNGSTSLGATFGAMYQMPKRVLLGMSYRPGMHYAAPTPPSPTAASLLPGFFQSIDVPEQFNFGIGWVPNRFARGDLSLSMIGASDNTALLRNDNTLVGTHLSFEPRLGVAYIFADYREFQATVFGGTYFEDNRIQGETDRIHFTGGLEAKLAFVTLGLGSDVSANYQDNLFSLGIDAIRVMELFDLIPHAWHPGYGGLFPNPFHLSDAGLARPLVQNWRPHGPDMNPIDVGLGIPKRVQMKVQELKEMVSSQGEKRRKARRKKSKAKRQKKVKPSKSAPQDGR